MPHRALGLLRHVNLALAQTLDQVVGRQIDEFDFIGLIENAVGDGFAYPDAGDPGDDIVQALDMLDVQRRVNADAGGDQLLDIEVALWIRLPGALVCANSSTSTVRDAASGLHRGPSRSGDGPCIRPPGEGSPLDLSLIHI